MFAARTSTWVTSALSLVILLLRLAVSRQASHRNLLGDTLVVFSILIIATRIPVICYVLQYGTAADALDGGSIKTHSLTEIKIGSVLTLIARFLATTFYWTQTALLLIFYQHVLGHIEWCHRAIKYIWVAIIATYLATTLSVFLECRPFSLYWQVVPKPDECTRAYVQIFMQGILNIIVDLMLLAVSYPLWTGRQFTISQNLRVAALMLTGTFCIIVTGLKLAYVVGANSRQDARSFWASVQILVSAFVANAPTIYGTINLMIRRRQAHNMRKTSTADSLATLTLTRTNTHSQASEVHSLQRPNDDTGFDHPYIHAHHHIH